VRVELNNNAEGGANGVTVSAANSGAASGNAWDATVGTPTITYDNTHSLGNLAYKVVAGGSAQQMAWTSASHGTQAETWGRIYLWSDGHPSSVTGIARFMSGGSQAARLRYESTGLLTISDSGNSPEFSTAGAIPTGQWIRLEWHIQFVATNATVELRTFNSPDSTTPTESLSVANAAGIGANCDRLEFGSFNASTWTGWMDGLNVNSIGFPGPVTRRRSGVLVSTSAVRRAATW
jgi:hypothetical protein